MSERTFQRLVNVLTSVLVAGMVAGVVAILGAPGWAVAGFGFTVYLTEVGVVGPFFNQRKKRP